MAILGIVACGVLGHFAPLGNFEMGATEDLHRAAWLEAVAGLLLLAAIASMLAARRRHSESTAVRQQKERFQALAEATGQIVWATNSQGEVEDMPDWRAFTGQSIEEVRGCGWTNALHPDDRERAAEAWAEAVKDRSAYNTEYRVRRKDGEYRYLNARSVPVVEPDGSVREWVGVCADITDRKKAEEAARRASAYNRSLIEASLDPLLTISAEGKVTDVNVAATRVTGVSRDKLVGTDFADYFTEPEKARNGYRRVFSEGFVTDYPLTIRHAEGGLTDVLYNASVYKDARGNVLGVVAAARDITERKRAEEALRRANAYNRSLLEASLDPLVTISASGKITDINAATESVTGRTRQELIGTDFADYFTDPERARASYQQVFREGLVQDYALEIRHRRGQLTPVIYNASVYRDEAGQVIGVFFAARDVTARRQAEDEIRKLNESLERRVSERTAELEAANKELEAFTYSVSHDLRAPLRHVDGFSKLLMEDFGPQLPEQARHFLERVRNGARQMGQLVDDLLKLSRVGRSELGLQITSLSSLVQEVVSELKGESSERSIRWKIAALPFVECDPTLVKQVLRNLLSNAVKFTRPRQEAVIEVGTRRHHGREAVFVRDNGVGFSMKYADKLFGIFQSLHRREDFEGTGVGLATVKRIVEKHHGRVWAEAELDRGATFYFTLGTEPSAGSARKGEGA
jgi:PAS domain S-box-containing protein